MNIRFTRHAELKFRTLARHGLRLTKLAITRVVREPDFVDTVSRTPLFIAQRAVDARRLLRVVYRIEYDTMVIITFYPGKRGRYEN